MKFDKSNVIRITDHIPHHMILTDIPSELQIPQEQSALLTLLARGLNARCIVEVGTFTGASTIALARGLAPGGRVITCDLFEDWTDLAREAFREAGVQDRIDLRLGPASQNLARLPLGPTVDMAFLDVSKVGCIRYWEEILPRMRPKTILVASNAGATAFAAHAACDARVTCIMLPMGAGTLLAQRN